jgi:L-Ala-D/L-Glu epimerase
MLQWSIEPIILELKYTWKISRNASDEKTNLIVTVSDGKHSGRGEAAPNIRYNESAEEGLKQFALLIDTLPDDIVHVSELREFKHQKFLMLLVLQLSLPGLNWKKNENKNHFMN